MARNPFIPFHHLHQKSILYSQLSFFSFYLSISLDSVSVSIFLSSFFRVYFILESAKVERVHVFALDFYPIPVVVFSISWNPFVYVYFLPFFSPFFIWFWLFEFPFSVLLRKDEFNCCWPHPNWYFDLIESCQQKDRPIMIIWPRPTPSESVRRPAIQLIVPARVLLSLPLLSFLRLQLGLQLLTACWDLSARWMER